MAKEALYPHVPKKKEPLFPHEPKGQQAAEPFTVLFWDRTTKFAKDRDEAVRLVKEGLDGWMQKGDRIVWVSIGDDDRLEPSYAIVVNAAGEDTDASAKILYKGRSGDFGAILRTDPDHIVEKYSLPAGKAMPRTPQQSKRLVELAVRASRDASMIAITEHHPAWKVVDRLESLMNDEEYTEYRQRMGSQIDLLAKTEGDPISKYCCRQCGDCAPEELLEEGRFLDRITWLRQHYNRKHPGMWGTGELQPSTIAVSPEYRHLLDLVDEPLPPDAY